MCYHKQQKEPLQEVARYYSVSYTKAVEDLFSPTFYENGFSFRPGPVITAEFPGQLQMYNWGLIPWWVKTGNDAATIKARTLNCISEEMYDKPSFRDAIKQGKRCLIPCTGFYEWRHLNGGKNKYPYYIHLPQKLFSLAGIYSTWVDKQTGEEISTYTILTTRANPVMEVIHNSKKRMPVILPQEFEKDWLSANLAKDDVLALCQPYSREVNYHTISELITSSGERDVTEVDMPFSYAELTGVPFG